MSVVFAGDWTLKEQEGYEEFMKLMGKLYILFCFKSKTS